MEGKRLATIVHISDLHFGDAVDGEPRLEDSVAKSMWQFHQVMDGWLGHSAGALETLPERILSLVESEDAQVVVTGDLTATGSSAQVSFGFRYLESYHENSRGEHLGLGLPTIRELTIPGNHDTWRGSRRLFGPDIGAIGLFETTPLNPLSINLPTGRKLVVHGIFTDSDVGPHSWRGVLGRGRFDSQLVRLKNTLGPRPDGEIRTLLLHHSPMDGTNKICGISNSSRKLLKAVAAQCGFSVLLTGHKHTPKGVVHNWTHSGVFEARCGTTTARDEVPKNWRSARNQRDRLPKNTLLVHRLIEADDGVLHWEVKVIQRTIMGFIGENPLPGIPTHPVWWP